MSPSAQYSAPTCPAQYGPSTPPDLCDPRFWRLPAQQRNAAFAQLRSLPRPVYFAAGRGKGFHALVRHADVLTASRKPEVFRSAPGVTTPPPSRWVRAFFGDSMVNLDDPEHARLRRVVSRAFTPRLLGRVEDDIRATASRILDEVAGCPAGRGGTDDFVAAVAARMPFEVICTMMGIPAPERRRILELIDQASENTGVKRSTAQRLRSPGRGLRALAAMQRIVARIGRERRRSPEDDLISALVAADVDGKGLTGRQLGAFFSLLLVAGVETTRNAMAHGLHLLTAHPQQRELLVADLEGCLDGAVEEIVRYCSPIVQFSRNVSRPYELNGCTLEAGDRVTLYFGSANRDEAVFADPDVFDITRSPNPHVGFGGGGPHFCLGAHLARQEMRALFGELFTRFPAVRSVAEPDLVPSNFDHRVGALPFTAAG